MGSQDVFRHINQQDDGTLSRIIERLEFRGKNPTFRGWLDSYIGRLDLTRSPRVLVLGCGTGVEARVIAARPGFSGQVIGLDISPALIEAARRFASEDGVDRLIDFQQGDAQQLDHADASFDVVIAHTLISHVSDVLAVLREATRVTRPGGQIIIFDGDYASMTFGYSDPEFGRAMDEAFVTAAVNNPRVMRTLPLLLPSVGLSLEMATPHVLAEIGRASFFKSFAETFAPVVSKAGLLPADQVNAWLAEQQQNHEQGVFFAASNYYTYFIRRMEASEAAQRGS